MGPIPGFAFQGRKSSRLAAAVGGRGDRLLHGGRRGQGPGNKVPIRKGYQHAKRRKEKCGDIARPSKNPFQLVVTSSQAF